MTKDLKHLTDYHSNTSPVGKGPGCGFGLLAGVSGYSSCEVLSYYLNAGSVTSMSVFRVSRDGIEPVEKITDTVSFSLLLHFVPY
jgi:hypothetical protein